MHLTKRIFIAFFAGILILSACNTQQQNNKKEELSIDFEKYTLSNGLDVILHQDKSDPIVAIGILIHAGSNREKPGRTGFAHFFEHMLFQRSENVKEGAFFNNINDWGGTFNGGTWTDGTVYYEVVPKDALEKVLWMESDRMGFFINSVTLASLEGEKPVVKNEKRQRVDNQPYGHTSYVINKALYPSGHPYNWQTIGELEDLTNATLDDVKEFYDLYYGPNNATLVLTGDFDKETTRQWIEKYFGEIPSRGVDTPMEPKPVTLDKTISLYHEDNFASLPEIRMTWPTVEQFNKDQWALDVLGQILFDGKRAPLYKEIVENQKLAPSVRAYHDSRELAGTFTIRCRANSGTDLDSVQSAIFKALENFEQNGVDQRDLDRIKAGLETDFYNGISSVLGKAFQLAIYNEFAGDPAFVKKDIANIKAVTKEDVIRAYNKYIKGKPYVVTSFVPKGALDLALSGAEKAQVKEEEITPNTESAIVEQEGNDDFQKTPSSFDRSVEPEFGEAPLLNPPTIWSSKLANGMGAYGIESNELPLVNFSIRIAGGKMLEKQEKVGLTNLLTDVMMEGTAKRTPEELEDAVGQLGANIRLYTSDESITITANCLTRNYDSTMALVQEILLEPRWDVKEFERLKSAALTRIRQRDANPNSVANMVMNRMLYGNTIMSEPIGGTLTSVESITLDDLKEYYKLYFSPKAANFHIAGNVTAEMAKASLESIGQNWQGKPVLLPSLEFPQAPESPKVYFVDIPGAKQSVIQIGRLTVQGNHEKYYPLFVANYKLGAGSSGRLFKVLREEKQFTYGAYSFVSRDVNPGPWIASSSVKSNVTKEAMDTFKEVIGNYASTYTDEDLDRTKTALIKQNTRNFETLNDLLGILHNISTYQLSLDYIDQQQNVLQQLKKDDIIQLIKTYMDLSKMNYVIVGDKATQFDRLKVDGIGNPVLVDKYGKVLESM